MRVVHKNGKVEESWPMPPIDPAKLEPGNVEEFVTGELIASRIYAGYFFARYSSDDNWVLLELVDNSSGDVYFSEFVRPIMLEINSRPLPKELRKARKLAASAE